MEIQSIDLGGVSGGGSRFKLDANGSIDLAWAEQAQAAGAYDFGQALRQDSAVPLARDLNYVLEFVRDNYRPLKYAQVLQSIPIPDWVERWEVSKITGTGKVQLGGQIGPRDIVKADFSRSTTTGRMFEVVNGYGYDRREMIRAAKLGINPETERAMIQAQAADEFLDALVATGLVGTAYADFGLGLTGLGNNADIAGAANANVILGTTKAGADSAWQDAVAADFALVLDDLHNGVSAVYNRSNERRNADSIVMPLDEFNALNRLRAANFSANVLDTFMTEWQKRIGKPGRIMVWDRFKALGTVASGPRVLYFDSTDTNVACYMTGKSYGVDQVLEVTRGFEVNASMVCGGVRVLDASGAVYQDLNPGA